MLKTTPSCHSETPTRPEPAPEQSGGHGSIDKEPPPQARHVALPRDAEAGGSAVVEVLAAAEPPGGALRGRATQRVPWQPKAKNLSFIDTVSAYPIGCVLDRSFTLFRACPERSRRDDTFLYVLR